MITLPVRMRRLITVVFGEPLSLFVVLGCMLFVVDRLWNGAPAPLDEATHIVVTASQQVTLRDAFRSENGRFPTAEEMRSRLDRWIEEQVLYREALALHLDRKDPIVHRELTQKMRFLLDDVTDFSAPTDAELQVWLDQHMSRYGRPDFVSFDQVFLSRGRRADHLGSDAAQIATTLASKPDAYGGLGDPFPAGQQIRDMNPLQLRRDFGEDFVAALQRVKSSAWSGPIASGFGLHLVRIVDRKASQSVSLSEVRQQVAVDYRIAQRERATQQAIDRLKKKYRVDFEAPTQ